MNDNVQEPIRKILNDFFNKTKISSYVEEAESEDEQEKEEILEQ